MNEIWEYRYVTPIRKGRWLRTQREAEDAAIKAGGGSRVRNGAFYADVFTEIERREAKKIAPRAEARSATGMILE